MADYMVWIWLGIIILTAVIEASTSDLISIWFTAGAFVAMVVSIFWKEHIYAQIFIFFIVSVILLIATRPIARKYNKRNEIKMNAEGVVGKMAIVTKRIDAVNYGEVKVEGQFWTAMANEELNVDDKVEILAIEGVKLIVKKVN